MCTDIELNFEPAAIKSLYTIVERRVVQVTNDHCSLAIFTEAEPQSFDELIAVVGRTIVNSVIIDAIKEGIEHSKLEEDEA